MNLLSRSPCCCVLIEQQREEKPGTGIGDFSEEGKTGMSLFEKELNDLHESLQDMMSAIDSSWAFRLYLNGEEDLDNVQTFQNIYQMEKDLEQKKPSDM